MWASRRPTACDDICLFVATPPPPPALLERPCLAPTATRSILNPVRGSLVACRLVCAGDDSRVRGRQRQEGAVPGRPAPRRVPTQGAAAARQAAPKEALHCIAVGAVVHTVVPCTVKIQRGIVKIHKRGIVQIYWRGMACTICVEGGCLSLSLSGDLDLVAGRVQFGAAHASPCVLRSYCRWSTSSWSAGLATAWPCGQPLRLRRRSWGGRPSERCRGEGCCGGGGYWLIRFILVGLVWESTDTAQSPERERERSNAE